MPSPGQLSGLQNVGFQQAKPPHRAKAIDHRACQGDHFWPVQRRVRRKFRQVTGVNRSKTQNISNHIILWRPSASQKGPLQISELSISHCSFYIRYRYIYIHNDISRAFQGSLGVFGKHKTHMTHVPRASSAPTCQVDVPQRPRTLPGGLSPLLQWAQRTSNKSGKHDKIQQKRRDETAVLLSLEADCLRLHMIAVQFRQHFCNANPEIDSKPVPVDMSKARQCCHVMCVLQGLLPTRSRVQQPRHWPAQSGAPSIPEHETINETCC